LKHTELHRRRRVGASLHGCRSSIAIIQAALKAEDIKAHLGVQELDEPGLTEEGGSIPVRLFAEHEFTSLVLNLDASVDGSVNFSVVTNTGTQNFNNIALTGSGSNFFTFTTIDGQRYSSISLTANAPVGLVFSDAEQFRIGGALRTQAVPDGGTTVVMLGAALAGLALIPPESAGLIR
jgi:hypothetical protein